WVVLADDVADGARRLLRLGRGVEPQLAHRIDDAPLHRLEPVAEERQCAVQDHVHRIVQVGAFGVLAQRDLCEAVEGWTDVFGHCGHSCGTGTRFYPRAAARRPPVRAGTATAGRPATAPGPSRRWPGRSARSAVRPPGGSRRRYSGRG